MNIYKNDKNQLAFIYREFLNKEKSEKSIIEVFNITKKMKMIYSQNIFNEKFKLYGLDIYQYLSSYELSEKTKRVLEEIHSDLRMVLLVSMIKYNITAYDGLRGEELQEKYFRSGASKAHYGQSSHNGKEVSLAVDISLYPIIWNKFDLSMLGGSVLTLSDQLYRDRIIKNKIKWGGLWSKNRISKNAFIDLPHYEINNWKNIEEPSPEDNEKAFKKSLMRFFIIESNYKKNIKKRS